MKIINIREIILDPSDDDKYLKESSTKDIIIDTIGTVFVILIVALLAIFVNL